MPELPEVEALAAHLRTHAVGRAITRVDIASLSVLKTVSPPWTELVGRTVTAAGRRGKYLYLTCGRQPGGDVGDARPDELYLVTHLARAGWLRWLEVPAAAPPRPGRGPLALRVHLGPPGQGPGFDLTEAGTKKDLAVWIVTSLTEVPGIARLGPDALSLSRDELADLLAGHTERLKKLLTDQSATAEGIRGALKSLARARPQDTVIAFFSGHGVELGRQFFFAPHEADAADVTSTCVPWSEILRALSAAPGR